MFLGAVARSIYCVERPLIIAFLLSQLALEPENLSRAVRPFSTASTNVDPGGGCPTGAKHISIGLIR